MQLAHTIRNVAFVALLPVAGASCVATVGPEPIYAEADYVPADISVYPQTVYQGQVVYLVNDHWYYRNGPRWVYYRHEPDGLVRQRAYVQQAPRAQPRVEERPERHEAQRPEEHRERAEEHHEGREGPPSGLRSPAPATQVR